MRSNHSAKNVDSGGLRRRGDLEHHDPPAGRTTRAISRRPRSRSEKLRAPKPTVAASNSPSAYGSSSASPHSKRRSRRLARARGRASPRRSPSRPPRRRARPGGPARSPGRRCPSRRRARGRPGRTPARSAARSRQRWCSPAVMTRVHQVVDPGDAVEHRPHLPLRERAGAGGGRRQRARRLSRRLLGACWRGRTGLLLQLREEGDERVDFSSRQVLERRHRRRRVVQRARDRRRGSRAPMSRQVRPGAVVAVLADLVAGQAARLRRRPACPPRTGVRPASLHVDLVRRAGVGAQVGQVRHREDHEDAGGRRDRPALGPALRAAVVERQQEQQDHADRRHADRRQRHEQRRLDHAQQLEEEEEVPLRPRHVGRRRRVRLRAELGAEDERHQDDRRPSRRTPSTSPWPPRRGRTACPSPSGSSTRGGTLLLALVHTAPDLAASRSSVRSSLGLHPRRRRRAELGDEVQVGADQRGDAARARAACGSRRSATASSPRTPRRRAGSRQVRADERAGAVDVHADDRRPVGALVERQQVAGEAT